MSKSIDKKAIKSALRYGVKWLEFQHGYNPYVGAQVAARVGGKLLLNKAFGYADLENEIPLTTDHLFRIASHSKTFTGVAVMQLVERGQLRLDDTIGYHIPELRESEIASVTVRHLLSHTGGIVRDGDDHSWWDLAKPFPTDAELIELATKMGKVFDPNVEFKYSNIGFSLLGLIIANASGRSYRKYTQRHIVDALGLKNTGPDLKMGRIDDYAVGHSSRAHGSHRVPIDHIDTYAESAATGFYSTASELTDYFQAHIPGDTRLISDVSKREMQQKIGVADENTWYGLGLVIEEIRGRTYIGHSGGYPGHITMSKVDRERKLSLSVLTNSAGGPAAILADGLLGLIDLAYGEKALTERRKRKKLKKFEGRFASLWGVVDVAVIGGRLYELMPMVDNPATMATELEVVGPTTLKLRGGSKFGSRGETLEYHFDEDGKVTHLTGASSVVPVEKFVLPDHVKRPY